MIALAAPSTDPGRGQPDRHEAEGLDLAAKRIEIQPQVVERHDTENGPQGGACPDQRA
jgi:hypothetical protein